jgi:hypothetical protein
MLWHIFKLWHGHRACAEPGAAGRSCPFFLEIFHGRDPTSRRRFVGQAPHAKQPFGLRSLFSFFSGVNAGGLQKKEVREGLPPCRSATSRWAGLPTAAPGRGGMGGRNIGRAVQVISANTGFRQLKRASFRMIPKTLFSLFLCPATLCVIRKVYCEGPTALDQEGRKDGMEA